MVKAKYQSVLNLGDKLKIQQSEVKVEGNTLKIKGIANNQYQKDLMWDEIKRVGGENPSDVQADISVADTTVYARHTVEKGETLGKIAKHYYGDSGKYNAIFEANKDVLDNPDMIHPGQQLEIPKQ